MKIADFYAHIQVGVLQETTVLHVFIIFSPCCSLGTQPLRRTTLGTPRDLGTEKCTFRFLALFVIFVPYRHRRVIDPTHFS